jgi:hypothetical protein
VHPPLRPDLFGALRLPVVEGRGVEGGGGDRHFSSSDCNFGLVPLPGVKTAGSFDVWFRDEIPRKFVTVSNQVAHHCTALTL